MDSVIYSLVFCLLISSSLALKSDFTCTRQPKFNVEYVEETIFAIDPPDFCKFTKDQTLTVTLHSLRGEVFHAFMLQAETPSHIVIGSWKQTTPHKVQTCSGAWDTITNQGYDPLNTVVVEWIAPKFFSHSQIEFVGSVMANGTSWYSSRSQICKYEEPQAEEDDTVGYSEVHDPNAEDETEAKSTEEEEDNYERQEATAGPDSPEHPGGDETDQAEAEGVRRDDAGSDVGDETEPEDEEDDDEGMDGEIDDESEQFDDEDDEDDEPMDTDHDQTLEDDLAAREAMKEQEDADEEDRKSEREAYQKKKMDEEQQHRDEIEKEREDFERAQAEEEEERQQRIRIEIVDKENYDRMKAEEEREAAEQEANRPVEKQNDEVSLNQVKHKFEDEDNKLPSGSGVVKASGLCLALAILRMLF